MVYVTDGSFEGILTAVFEAFRNKEEPEEITLGGDFQLPLGTDVRKYLSTLKSLTGSGVACRVKSHSNPLKTCTRHISANIHGLGCIYIVISGWASTSAVK